MRIRRPPVGETSIKTAMRTALGGFAIGVAFLLTVVGCGKPTTGAPTSGESQAINATEFRPAFATTSPEIKAIVDNVMMSIQSSLYPDALASLDKLANISTLTEPQKKVVANLTDQLKRKQAGTASKPSP